MKTTQGIMRQDLYQELYEVENSHWWHKHKRQVVHYFIQKFSKKGKVLDIGSGTGKILEELRSNNWSVVGVDGSSDAINFCQKRKISIKNIDVNQQLLPFKNDQFDLVLCLDFLEHINNEKKLLKEVHRVLKNQGILIFTVPAFQFLFSYWDKMLGHKRRYTSKGIRSLIQKNNYNVHYISYYFFFIFLPAIIIRFIKKLFNKKQISDFQTLPIKHISVPIVKLFNIIELFMLKRFKLPLGLSIICVVSKNE
jgi:methionine biosynthesis protein MetW